MINCPKVTALNVEGGVSHLNDSGGQIGVEGKNAKLPEGKGIEELHSEGLICPKFNDADVAALLEVPTLQSAALNGTALKHGGLRRLALANTAITDQSLERLAKSPPAREKINISKTKVTTAGVAKLRAALPKCEIVADEPQQN